jgi:hypothetical protein
MSATGTVTRVDGRALYGRLQDCQGELDDLWLVINNGDYASAKKAPWS